MFGTVTGFDPERGVGTVRCDTPDVLGGVEAGKELGFHCTAIADGTRRIQVGAKVHFVTVPAHLGRMEARCLEPAPG